MNAHKMLQVAQDSQVAANMLYQKHPRSCASRYYYAAFQASTAILQHIGETPPTVEGVQREGWSHDDTPGMLLNNLKKLLTDRDQRKKLYTDLSWLYKMRVQADYEAEADFENINTSDIRKRSNYVVKVAIETVSRGK